MARVKIKRKASELLELAELIIQKHEADGNNSPLKAIDIADMKQKTQTVRADYDEAKQLRRRAEMLTQNVYKTLGIDTGQSSMLNGNIIYYIMQCRDVLKGLNRQVVHHLGDWGFTVDESTQRKKKKKAESVE